jgi:hypothetical protein
MIYGRCLLLPDEYCEKRMIEFNEFKEKVKTCGSSLIQLVLNEEWFNNVQQGAEKVWSGDGRSPYQCKFFPYRWLYEQEQWEFINTGLKKIDELISKKQMLRSMVLKIVSNEWMVAHAAALEISALCRFVHDEVLIDIEPKIISTRAFRSDALIKVDQNEILIELTAITKSFGSPNTRVLTLSSEKLINQVLNKIKEKAEKQLSYTSQPSVLIISPLNGFSADPSIAKWVIEENLHIYPKINAYLVSDNLFQYCCC